VAKGLAVHRPLLILSVSLLAIASLAIVTLAASLEPTPVARTASGRDVSTVLRYYDAVNEMIATGDPGPLRNVLHVDFTRGTPETESNSFDSLEAYVTWLHAIAPDTRLVAGPVAGDGEQVIAQVSVTTSASSLPLGFALSDPTSLWPEFELFHVSLGQITERRAAARQPPEVAELYTAGATASPDDSMVLELATYTFTGIARARMWTSSLSAVFRVTSGNLMLSLSMTAPGSALLLGPSLDTSKDIREEVLPGTTGRAGPGSVVVVPPQAEFSLLNVERDPASATGVSISLKSKVELTRPVLSNSGGSGVSIVENLSIQIEPPGENTQLSLGTVRIAPGASLPVSSATRLMLVLDGPSGLLLSGPDPDCQNATATPTPAEPPRELPSSVQMLCPDESQEGYLINAGDEPVNAWVVAVTIAADD
jgi:hypothetical protein